MEVKKDGRYLMSFSSKLLSLLKALLVSYILTGVMLLAVALALYKFGIGESMVNLAIIIVYVLSSFVGGLLAGKLVKEKKFLWGLILGLTYMTVICLVSFILNGTISLASTSALTALMLCVGGGMLGGMLS
jgi:putative membrane protein (TIGR04086 family)